MLNQMPLYRVKFTGYEITAIEQLFEWLPSVQHVLDSMWEDIREIPTEAEEYFEREKARFTSEINAAEAQFMEDLESTEVSNQQAFQTWFDTIKGILDEDTAGHLQGEIEVLQGDMNTAKARLGKELTATITAGQTSLTFTDTSITTNSTIDVYTSVYGVNPEEMTVSSGSLTLTFDSQASDIGVKVVIK